MWRGVPTVSTEVEMRLDHRALQDAADDLFSTLGALDDLGPELSNTVANVYYRFHLMSRSLTNPTDALGVPRGQDMASTYRNVMGSTGRAVSEYQFIAGMISSLRQTRAQNAAIGEYLVRHAIDQLKYRIPNANKKTPIRRAIERQFRSVDEVAGLYGQFQHLQRT
jgi:hypothetical protein